MARADAWRAWRQIVAERDGYRCTYCGIPTAATIEHVTARANEGKNDPSNLRIACPSCNSRKRDMPLDEWQERKGWLLPEPADLPNSVEALVAADIAGGDGDGIVYTGNPNARLRLGANQTILEVRYGKKGPWVGFRLAPNDDPRVVRMVYEFLRRHHAKAGRDR